MKISFLTYHLCKPTCALGTLKMSGTNTQQDDLYGRRGHVRTPVHSGHSGQKTPHSAVIGKNTARGYRPRALYVQKTSEKNSDIS